MINIKRKDRVVHLQLDIPPVNVLDTENCQLLSTKFEELSEDKTITAVVLSGEGKCFSAGASVEEHKKAHVEKMITSFGQACKAVSKFPAPVIALIHGFCFGGGLELAMYCDFIIADPSAKMAVPEISLAFFPPLACSVLPEIIGRQNAAYMILSGETVPAEQALTMGLVQKIMPQSEWENVISGYNQISTPVLRLAKKALRINDQQFASREIDDLFLNQLYQIEDVAEGIASFNEKRKPQWKHK